MSGEQNHGEVEPAAELAQVSVVDQRAGRVSELVKSGWRLADWPQQQQVQAGIEAAWARTSMIKFAGLDAVKPAGSFLDAMRVGPGFDAPKLFDPLAGATSALEALREQTSAMAREAMETWSSIRSPLMELGKQTSAIATQYSTLNLAGPLVRADGLVEALGSGPVGLDAWRSVRAFDAMQGHWRFDGFNLVDHLPAMASVFETMREQTSLMAKSYLDTWSSMHSPLMELSKQASAMAKEFADMWFSLRTPSLIEVGQVTSALWAGVDHQAWLDRMIGGQHQALLDVLRGWSTQADRGFWAAKTALRMAIRAVAAVKRGDVAAVWEFMQDWLGFRIFTMDLVGSASLVLLNVDAWLPDGFLPPNFDPRPKLRKLTLDEHRRVTRLITDPERRAGRQSVRSLDEPVMGFDGSSIPLGEREADEKAALELEAVEGDDIGDPRVLRVWSKLTDREREIVRAKSLPGTTWPAAAVACGGSPAEGERVRRKVNRLSKGSAEPAQAVG